MNDEASRIYGYTFISNATAEFFQQKFTLSQAARADANPQSSLFKANLCLFVFQESFSILSYDCQVCISDMAMLFQTV